MHARSASSTPVPARPSGPRRAVLGLAVLCLVGSSAARAASPPPGYDRAWSQTILLDRAVVLHPPQMTWESGFDGGRLRLFWVSTSAAGLSLATRTLTFRDDRMEVGPTTILRQGGSAPAAGPGEEDAPSRPHDPLLVPAVGPGAGERLVWVEGSPGKRSLWTAPLEGERLGDAQRLAPPSADARAPALALSPEGEPPGATLAWIEGIGGTGRLVVTRSLPDGGWGTPATAFEGAPVMAFALARRGQADFGLVLERTGERTAHLWSYRMLWPPETASGRVFLSGPQPVVLPDRERLDFTWTVSPAGELYVLAIVALRDRSVLPAAYLFRLDGESGLPSARSVPLTPGSQPGLSWSRGLDLVWTAPDGTETWQIMSAHLDPASPEALAPVPVTASWRSGFAPSALRDPQGHLHAAWVSAARGGTWELLYRTDRLRQTTLLAERLASVAGAERPERLLGFLGFFAFIATAAFLPAQGPALLLVWLWERALGASPSRWLWLAGVLAADLVSRVGILPLWSPRGFDLGAWALTFRPAYLLAPGLVVLWLLRRPTQTSTHRGRWAVALFYLAAQVAMTAWPFTLWQLAGLR